MFNKFKPTPSAFQHNLLIKDLLHSALTYAPNQQIVYDDKHRYSYLTFADRVSRLAGLLTRLGVKTGDTVAILDWDSHRYLECYFAVPMMGAVLHTVNIRLAPEQLCYTINHAEDTVVLVNTEFLPLLAGIKNEIGHNYKIITLNDTSSPPNTDLSIEGDYEQMMQQADNSFDFVDFEENTVATVFYTTGTMGRPKGVCFTHRQLVLHTMAMVMLLSGYSSQFTITSDDVYMPLTPMFHVHAWGVPYMMTSLGAKQVYPGRYEPEKILHLAHTEGVTFSHCVPTILHMLIDTPAIKKTPPDGWKMIVGGSALSKKLCKTAMDCGINPVSGYGLSETCPVMTLSLLKPYMLEWPLDEQINYRCKTGLPTPFVDVDIVDPLGNPLPHDGVSVGEVVVRSPWVTLGYLLEPDLSEMLWKDGWLHTGDIGYFTTDGYLQITDRIKDVIKTGGEWLSTMELEDIITQHEAVSEAAIIGVQDEKWGERPLALVVLKKSYKGKIDEDDLKSFFMKFAREGKIPRYAVPKKIFVVDAISKTSVGKINKKNLREQLGLA